MKCKFIGRCDFYGRDNYTCNFGSGEHCGKWLELAIKAIPWHHAWALTPEDPDLQESNSMYSINVYVFGNLLELAMNKGERVHYVMSMDTEVDPHSVCTQYRRLHRNRTDVLEILPADMKVGDKVPDVVGTLLCRTICSYLGGVWVWQSAIRNTLTVILTLMVTASMRSIVIVSSIIVANATPNSKEFQVIARRLNV